MARERFQRPAPSFSASDCDFVRSEPGAGSWKGYRRNASGSPPSTGMTWPVVLALWSPARKQIALALSSGRIGRRVIVRRA